MYGTGGQWAHFLDFDDRGLDPAVPDAMAAVLGITHQPGKTVSESRYERLSSGIDDGLYTIAWHLNTIALQTTVPATYWSLTEAVARFRGRLVATGIRCCCHACSASRKATLAVLVVVQPGAMSGLADETRWLDATDQAALVAKGDVTPSELLEAAIERIEQSNPALNAVVIEWYDHARSVAADPDLPDGPFRGVPFLLKDLYASLTGQTLSSGNQALKAAGKIDAADTTLVARFKAAGLVIAGRTNTPEMGSLPTTQPLAWGATRNPWVLERTPGGSSGGAAAAVAVGMVPFAHASDGAGSIRIPASCCGLVGFKPSQGRITVGPVRAEAGLGVELGISRTVRDTAGLLDAVHGPGIGDTVIAPAPQRPYLDEVGAEPGRLRIGLLDVDPRGGFVHEDCVTAVRAAASMLEGLGHTVEPAWPACLADNTLPEKFLALGATGIAMWAREFSEKLGREVTADDFEPVNWVLIERAQRLSAVDYAAAQAAGWAFRRALQQWWADGWDLLLTPTLAEPPPPLTEFENNPEHPIAPMQRARRFTVFTSAFNISGQPAISLPLHRNTDGLPIGIQLAAGYGREDVLIRVASQLESAHPWSSDHPTIP